MPKLKSLVKTFSYRALLKECEKQDWRLPTLEEAKELETTHDEFWIQPTVPIHNKYDAMYYSKSRNCVGYMHKDHGLTSAIIALPQICSRCEQYLYLQNKCDEYDFELPVEGDKFGCTTGFRKGV